MCNETDYTVIHAQGSEEPTPVQRVKASLGQLGTITDVMQPNRRDKRPIKEAEPFVDTFRLGSRALDVPPATLVAPRSVRAGDSFVRVSA